MLFYAKKWFIWSFLKISILLDFVTKLIFKSQRNLPENINKEALWKTAIPMKNSSKILNRRNITKKSTFSVLLSFWRGVTKLEAFQWYKVTKLNPPKPSPLVCQLKIIQYSRYIHTSFIHKHSLRPISISSQLSAQWAEPVGSVGGTNRLSGRNKSAQWAELSAQ
jgi:hypothetical protein